MSRRQPALPTLWLMTDERIGADLRPVIVRLPKGAGVVVRHYSLASADRLRLARSIVRLARSRRLVVALAGDERLARRSGAALVHNPDRRRSRLPRTFAVHSPADLRRARMAGASAVFISPLFATRSHPGGRPLGRMRAAALAKLARPLPAYALGGLSERRFRTVERLGFSGWAAIDAWTDGV